MATDYNIKQLSRFKRPILEVPAQLHDNDSGFFAIKFMELWNGESFHLPILTVRPNIVLTLSSKTLPLCCNVADLLSLQNQENAAMYRDQLLYYAIYHQINTIEKLPAGLQALKPRR